MESEPMRADSPVGLEDELEIREFMCKGLDFDEWVSLISIVEQTYPDNIAKICLVYDSFLSEFPLCHGYWRRYADHKIRLCSVDEVVDVFERSVQSATYSVSVWLDYCTFCMSVFENPSDIRRLFRRGLSYVGKDYLCHTLWDKYIIFESSQQQWSLLAQIYVEALRFPTKKLHIYYDSFKKLAALNNKNLGCQSKNSVDLNLGSRGHDEVAKSYSNEKIYSVVKDLFDPSISLTRSKKLLQQYISIGEHLYKNASKMDRKVRTFEVNIRRTYFDVKPLNVDQLENWHQYLDFVEKQEDFDWGVKLYERCLIPCANYPEYWMRYVDFMEIKGGREIANYALSRATKVFLKRLPVIHLFNARFKEHQGDVIGSHSAFLCCDAESDSEFVDLVIAKANMERRLGNFETASKIYEEAIEMAAKTKKWQNLPTLYVHFSRLKHMISGSAEAARDVLIDGVERLPGSKLLLEELINFATMNGGKQHIHALDSVIDTAISPQSDESLCLDDKDAEEVSSLYLKFVDLFGTILDVRKAWNRHIKLFPHSVRTSFCEKLTANMKHLKLARAYRETTAVPKSSIQSRDSCPEHSVQLRLQDDEFPNHDSPDCMAEPIVPARESNGAELDGVPVEVFQSGESICDEQKGVELLTTEVDEQSIKDFPETFSPPMESESSKVLQPLIEATTESQATIAGTISEQDIIEPSNKDDMQPEFEHVEPEPEHEPEPELDPEQEIKSLPLDFLSLHIPQDDSTPDLNTPMLSQSEAPRETSNAEINQPMKDEDSCISSQELITAPEQPQTETKVVNPSSSTGHQSPIPTEQAPLQLQIPTNSNRASQVQTNNPGKVRRESTLGPRGQLLQQRKPRPQHQVSPQTQQAEQGGPGPTNHQGFPSQNPPSHPQIQQNWRAQPQYQANTLPSNPTRPNAWPLQTMPSQNYPSTPQPMQSGELGLQNSQAYSQLWQHYYSQLQLYVQQQQQQQQQFRPSQQLTYQQQQYYQQPPPYQQYQIQQQQQQHFNQQHQLYQTQLPQLLQQHHNNGQTQTQLGQEAAALVLASQSQEQASTPAHTPSLPPQ